MALSESRGIYFPLGAAFLGSMVQPGLDRVCVGGGNVEKLCGQGDGIHPPTALTKFLISSPKLQPPVAGTPKPKRTPLPLSFSFLPHWVRSTSVTCHKPS